MTWKTVKMLFGKEGMEIKVPENTEMLEGNDIPKLEDPEEKILAALSNPIGSPSLKDLLLKKKPKTVAISVSDITRPVPNKQFLPQMLSIINECGIPDEKILIVVGTGMHRPSTDEEMDIILGQDILNRVEVVDHTANKAETLIKISDAPPVGVCKRFYEADSHIITGLIEPHFMAGFSGGRKGVCPALVDLETLQRFHGYETLSKKEASSGILKNNPCHEIALNVAKKVGVDFLFNVAITHERELAGIYCGDLEKAHWAGCKQVSDWVSAEFKGKFDLVVTCAGGYPLDQNFYQTVKGMCGAIPALHEKSKLLTISNCANSLGSGEYTDLKLKWGKDWKGFLESIEKNKSKTELDQWELQMECKLLSVIGVENSIVATDGIPSDVQEKISMIPAPGDGCARERAQAAIDSFFSENPEARIAVIPQGPYTMLKPVS
jgi:nickel-dependent lactate racemase